MKERYRGNLAADINSELLRAFSGKDLQVSSEDWLIRFGLDGDEPDGKTLIERIVESKNIFTIGKILYLDLDKTFKGAFSLIAKMGVNQATLQEEQLAANLAQIAVRQIQREGDICPGASALACSTFAVRPQFFPEELHPFLTYSLISLRQELMEQTTTVIFRTQRRQ